MQRKPEAAELMLDALRFQKYSPLVKPHLLNELVPYAGLIYFIFLYASGWYLRHRLRESLLTQSERYLSGRQLIWGVPLLAGIGAFVFRPSSELGFVFISFIVLAWYFAALHLDLLLPVGLVMCFVGIEGWIDTKPTDVLLLGKRDHFPVSGVEAKVWFVIIALAGFVACLKGIRQRQESAGSLL